MADIAKPAEKPQWATGNDAAVVTPPEAKQLQGWIQEMPPHQFFNWFQKWTGEWINYFENRLDTGVGGAVPTVISIASGAISPVYGTHIVDTEGNASADDLTNISTAGLADGRLLLLKTTSAARVVTVKNNAGGAGSILTNTGGDIVLDTPAKNLLLVRVGTAWHEISLVNSRGRFLADAGSAAAPAVSFEGDKDTGFANLNPDELSVIVGGLIRSVFGAATTSIDATTLNFGTANATTINLGRPGATVNIAGAATNIQSVNSAVIDKLVRLNSGGAAASAGESGIEFEEGGVVTGFIKTTANRNATEIKAPNRAGSITLTGSASAFTHEILSQATAARQLIAPDASGTAALVPAGSGNVKVVSGALAISEAGVLPIGAVIATFPHLTGAYACTATTAADANGFVQCNGQTIADATAAINAQVIPNLNNNVFIQGNATSGTTGGGNTVTLSTANIPVHAHVMDHGHAHTFALTNNTVASSAHVHDYTHNHQVAHLASGILYMTKTNTATTAAWTTIGAQVAVHNNVYPSGAGQVGTILGVSSSNIGSFYTSGIVTGTNGAANTDVPSASSVVTLSGAVTNFTGSTGNAGTGTAFDNRPSYITARYIMRIK